MKEIDNMLDTWIRNSIIRDKLRKLITKEIEKSTISGYEMAHDEVRAD